MVDQSAPVEATLKIVDALQSANKDFDLVLLPNPSHGYLVHCAWDYLVERLLGVIPPSGFELSTSFD